MDATEDRKFIEVEQVTTSTQQHPETLMQRLRRWLIPSDAQLQQEDEDRLKVLDMGILRYPNAPSGYVLRGELYLNMGYYDLAVADFQKALALVSPQQLAAEDWGFVTQLMGERALDGLNRAMRLKN